MRQQTGDDDVLVKKVCPLRGEERTQWGQGES
jgi:hypothetical protein